ncbi:efflux transporter outer membrane subunit [Gluconacetobacter tumulicola]|uniref:Efflux transporter outer membrane subunit n=1 Tax=Gluconacetobacter tumulicola TaxID=1017177 RepID=A0A7W4P992_9PROT|nr:efflux transporter outer membrane subunit [Gluconacetobacter tumulicola]MBB2180223.1 efflux transporter outer membrane subunit [Gluconacetobacter tumulicola]
MTRASLGRTATLVAMASLGLSACAVGPDYHRPQAQLAPFHSLAAVQRTQDGRAIPPLDHWWTGFDDPELVTIVQRALAQNLDLAAALARVRQARGVAAGAGANLLPTFDLNSGVTAERLSEYGPFSYYANGFPGFHRDQREFTVGPAASWEIDLFGGLRRAAAAARAEEEAAESDNAGVRVSVAADAADAYLQIRGLQAQIDVTQNQIETDDHLVRLTAFRRSAGQGTDREVAQAEALLHDAQATLPDLRIALEAQMNRLDVLMGAQPGTYARELSVPGAIPSVPAIGDADRPADMLRRRPDVIAAERRLAASNERIGEAIADYYPKISLSGALGFDSLRANHFLSAKAFQPAGSGALRWRLFDFGKVAAEVTQARGASAEALAQYRQTVLRAAEDVENALSALAETQIRVQRLNEEVASLERARTLSEVAFKAGSITLTDVLDADRQLLVARNALDATRASAARSAVGAYRALGGGWDIGGQEHVAAAAPIAASKHL